MNRRLLLVIRPLLALVLLLSGARFAAAAPAWQERAIGQVLLLNGEEKADARLLPYRPLVVLASGGTYHYPDVRRSLESLNRTGMFSDLEVKVQERQDGPLDVLFILKLRPRIRALEFGGNPPLSAKALRAAIYSLRRGDIFSESQLPRALAEIQALLRSRGYFNAQASPQVRLERDGVGCVVQFVIAPGRPARIRRLQVNSDDPKLAGALRACFPAGGVYLAGEFAKGSEKATRLLKRSFYNFPEIKVQEEFIDAERSEVDITVSIACGFTYRFIFQGLAPRMAQIADVWERRVFEKWAEDESRARLLNYLKNEGYLDARVDSAITTRGNAKTIVFTAEKNRRYRLGRIAIHGNRSVDTAKVREIMHADDVPFHKLAWLRLNSLVADMEVLKLYYYYLGIAPIEIRVQPRFQGGRADIDVFISEGRKQLMASVEFSGNRAFSRDELYQRIKSRTGAPYVPRQLSEDVDSLLNFYRDRGYDEATVASELSAGDERSLLITIREGPLKRMGRLIIVGAPASQSGLLRRIFPLVPGAPFSRNRVEAFRSEAENSAIFSEVRVEPIARDAATVDVLVKVTPDRSRLYGLGFGWEERRGPRGTFEYQEKNLFNSIYSLAATLQLGANERRGILAVDAPYLFRDPISTSFKVWEENENYPSYRFIRWGLGATLMKKFSEKSYLLGAARWYRTTLKELSIPVFGVDQLDQPFDTTALQVSFVNEGRDNPFNPQRGHFLSADLKLGLPIFEKDYTFLKLYWNYQKHYPLLHDGAFSFSVKNGIGFGDMSITERFFAGGGHSFRGTSNDRLGPINTAAAAPKGSPEGGNVLLLLNVEATVPSLLPMKDLYFTLFADVGNVFAKSSDFNLSKMERALGFGLKYRTPLGPIRFDIAFNLRRAAEKNFLVFIGIGNVY
jgi:outer membrane protein assembly complex protein YaeT